nr:hypothetical protein [Rhodoblastus acidophilus]
MALLRSGPLKRPTTLIYLYRSHADALFVDELNGMAASQPLLTSRLVTTGDDPIDPRCVIPAGEDVSKAEFWLCGPPPMIDAFAPFLHRRGIANRRMHFEDFGPL